MDYISENLSNIKNIIKDICDSKGMDYNSITIVAVTKTVDVDVVKMSFKAGITDIGENKVQEIQRKYEDVKDASHIHLIGHLQSNKVRHIIDKVKLIHSVDRLSLMKEINKRALAVGVIADVLIQVNVAKEETKYGIDIDDVENFIQSSSSYNNVKIKGLMTMAPFVDDPEDVRYVFKMLKNKYDELSKKKFNNAEMIHLSMGMTNDFKVALEEGSNMIRIGTAIFGKREYN